MNRLERIGALRIWLRRNYETDNPTGGKMITGKNQTPLAFWVALMNITLGTIGIITGFILWTGTHGIEQFFLGLLLLGFGEYLNNPRAPQSVHDADTPGFFERRRNTCGLGNLLDIAGVLMLAIGAGTLFF